MFENRLRSVRVFQRLLGSKLTHPDPQVRAKAFAAANLDAGDLRDGLTTETHPTVLTVIIARADDVHGVLSHAQMTSNPSSIQQQARARLAALATSAVPAEPETWHSVYSTAFTHGWTELKQLLQAVSVDAGSEVISHAALQAVAQHDANAVSQQQLKELVLNSQNSGLRQDAANLVIDPVALEACCAGIKDRDKTVYRTLKTRLDAHKTREALRSEAVNLIASCDALKQAHILAQPESIAMAHIRLQKLSGQISHVSEQASDLPEVMQLQQAFAAVSPDYTEQLAAARHISQERQRILLALDALTDESAQTPLQSADTAAVIPTEQQIQQLREQWLAIKDSTEFEEKRFIDKIQRTEEIAKQRAGFAKILQQAADKLQSYEESTDISEPQKHLDKITKEWGALIQRVDETDQPPLNERYQVVAQRLQAKADKIQKAQTKNTETVNKLSSEFSAALANGDLKQATSLQDKLRSRLATMNLEQAVKSRLEQSLKDAAPKLEEYRKWRHFGTLQARENLIGEANMLAAEPPASPKVLASKVKQMREAWKKLDSDDGRSSEAHWQTFSAACKQAYIPAKKHFNDLSKARKENEKNKRVILTQLSELLEQTDWESPDWAHVYETDKVARREWQKSGTVDFKVRKELDEVYETVCTALNQHLSEQRELDLRRRQLMITKLQQEFDQGDMMIASASAKTMQRQWRPLVQADRKTEQSLWHEFRSLCDQVFAQLKEKSKAEKQEWQADADERRALCASFDELLADASIVDEKAINLAKGTVSDLAKRWSQRHTIPKTVFTKLEKSYTQAKKNYANRTASARQVSADKNTKVIQQQFLLCQQIEDAALQSSTENKSAEQYQQDWSDFGVATGPLAKELTKRMNIALLALQGDIKMVDKIRLAQEKNLGVREEMCLLGELVADLNSPDEFLPARRELQVQRLKDALQGTALEKPEELKRLVTQWYTEGGVSASCANQIYQRFEPILQAAGAG